jgi:arylsulfatase A-like enzyme
MTPKRIILVTSDHMRADCIGAWGNSEVVTPNLDRLATAGVGFTQCYCQNPVCMPSRASFMTGYYPPQTGVTRNGIELPDGGTDGGPSTIADHLAGLGYQTTHIGKLHLENHEESDLDDRPARRYGFSTMMRSEARGCYFDAWMKWLAVHHPDEVSAFTIPRATEHARGEREVRGRTIDAPWQHSHAGWIADTGARFLAGNFVHREAPQFLHLGFHHPHPPLNPTAEAYAPYEDRPLSVPSRDENEAADKPEPLSGMLRAKSDWSDEAFLEYKRYFYALITEMDLAVGLLLDRLEEADMLDDSLIVFTSDHGDMCGNHGMTHKGPSFFDEIMNVPLLFHWPRGLGTDARTVSGLVELVDLVPTLVEFAGGRPSGLLPGVSYAEDLRAKREIAGKESVFAFADHGMAMVRTAERKYLRYRQTGAEVLYEFSGHQPKERFNLANDADREVDLAAMRTLLLDRLLDACRSPRFREKCF